MSDKDFEIDELVSDYEDADGFNDEDPNAFEIRDPLPPPSATVFTTQQLHQLIHEGHVDLSPPYQRAVVWSKEKQMTLIESIFRNFYIPPVLFFIRSESEDPDLPLRVCMDGKQRLSSIQAFFDGQIPYKDPVTRKSFYYTVPSSQARKRLLIPPKYKQIFSQKHITCVEFSGIEPAIERDIFQRVQLGVALTAAEKIAAISSPKADWITELNIRHVRGVDDGLNVVLKWDASRGKDFQCIAQVAYCVENLPNRTVPGTLKLAAWLQQDDVPTESFKQEIETVLKKYWIIASSENLKQAFTVISKIVAPVEFVFIGVLIAVLHHCREEVIAEEVLRLRQYIRSLHKDVRSNNRVVASMWDFIAVCARRNGVDYFDTFDPPTTIGNTSTGTGKRKKREQGDFDDQEYRSTPLKKIGGTPRTRKRAAGK